MAKTSISILVPGVNVKPGGGLRIILEYANRLSDRGYIVTLIHDGNYTLHNSPIPKCIRQLIIFMLYLRGIKWFNLNKEINRRLTFSPGEGSFPDSDYVMATAAVTAKPVIGLSSNKGKKIYLIQDWETWNLPEDELIKTFHAGMQNIAISHWLAEKVASTGAPCDCIANPIDTKVFRNTPGNSRMSCRIALMYNTLPHKGFEYAWEAIELAKREMPSISVDMFGVEPRPSWLPKWASYTYCATDVELREIYNRSEIYLCASINEGFGLTCVEAMACGAALVVTDFLGSREYAEHEINSLVCPTKDSLALSKAIIRLLTDDELRLRLSAQGQVDARKRGWDDAVDKFEALLAS